MKQIILITVFALSGIFLFAQVPAVHHALNVTIRPETSEIAVTDTLTIPNGVNPEFLLNAALTPKSLTKGVKLKKVSGKVDASDVGMDRDDVSGDKGVALNKWVLKGTADPVVITYSGKIDAAVEQSEENYQRGFSQSPGIICNKGVYLAGSTFWVPVFDDRLMTFSLTTQLPPDWKNVTQGKRIYENSRSDQHIDTWVCDKPQEEVFLIAAAFTEYSHDMNSGIKAMAFLRSPDEGLANKYLEVTEQYMDMYQGLIGDYPYSKFALVENFWETGYGMPSFTLLGEKIIRFPFILHSSYPHELLHNWWGNSVYVDFDSGNWCEGITVFMADHLIKEQHGAGAEYRRSILQKFTNIVTPENDFPISRFIARHDGPSEAIGYGKAMMMWQMLRKKLGDELFVEGARKFYEINKFKTASFDDIRLAMEEVSGMELSSFFDQWVNRTGAPEIAVENLKTDRYGSKYRIVLTLKQNQNDDVFVVDVPVNVACEKGLETFVFEMNRKEQEFQMTLDSKPLKLAVDPQYDVFRILDPAEVPPTLTKIWGSKNNVIILPSEAPESRKEIYQHFADQWKAADHDHFSVLFDSDIETLPKDETAWILGFENKFAPAINLLLGDYNSAFTSDSVSFSGNRLPKQGNSFIWTLFDKEDLARQTLFVSIDNDSAVAGLVRKLPHYGKYSYLAFTGSEPVNIAKGQWPVLNSPMLRIFDENARDVTVALPEEPLAELKPVFSENRLLSTVKYLASDELKGRGLGTPELDQAAGYIAEQFEEAGLEPVQGNSYYQKFVHHFNDKGDLNLTNVIGIIPGSDPNLKEEPVVISAHYDHLGTGWPDVHKGDEGKIHPGADDNASGVAILIELARNMAKTVKPKRTIVFLACSGEEAGLIGSRYFAEHQSDYFKGNIFADVNIDTDGSLFDKKLLVLNANSAKEWKFIFMGTDYTTGIPSQVIDKALDASDQVAFIEKGIPAVQLFTGATENYHRPSDTFDKIDGAGMVKVATVAKEVVEYLADRSDPMHFTGKAAGISGKTEEQPKTARRVSTGSVPDFTFTGTGVKISAVIPGSAGETAGLQPGDIIIAVDGNKTDDLKTYSDLLKKYQPGEVIKIKILRNAEEMIIPLKLGER